METEWSFYHSGMGMHSEFSRNGPISDDMSLEESGTVIRDIII